MTETPAAVRKAQQRARDRARGMVEVVVKVPQDRAADVRRIAQKMRQKAGAGISGGKRGIGECNS